MGKKNDKRLCWNCDGYVSLHLQNCPYCGVDLSAAPQNENSSSFALAPSSSFDSSASRSSFSSFQQMQGPSTDTAIPPSPYASGLKSFSINEQEWNQAVENENHASEEEPEEASGHRRELMALLLLLPGVVFFLFGLVLLLFSDEGVLTLAWNQSFAYFYFLGAVPLLLLGWKSLK